MDDELDAWPFGDDADRDDPLTRLRIAVTSSHPGWSYLVAFDRASQQRPTEAEAAMLVSFLDEYKGYWYRENWFQRKMEQRLLDVDGGANGVIFHKWGPDDWGYRRHSYTIGMLFTVTPPDLRDDPRFAGQGLPGPKSLLELMDYIHTIAGVPAPHWVQWRDRQLGVFGPQS